MVKRKSTSRNYKNMRKVQVVERVPRNRFTTGKSSVTKTCRMLDFGQITTAANPLGAYQFRLSDLPGYTDFAIFDEYKITGVEVTFMPDFNSNVGVSGTEYALPHLFTAIDYNDASAPGGENTLLQNESCIHHVPGKPARRYVQPRVATTLWQSGVASGFGAETNKWIDTNSFGVAHYGIKYALITDVDSPEVHWAYRVTMKFYLSFKKVI